MRERKEKEGRKGKKNERKEKKEKKKKTKKGKFLIFPNPKNTPNFFFVDFTISYSKILYKHPKIIYFKPTIKI